MKTSLVGLEFYACVIHTMKLNTRTYARGMSPWLNFTLPVHVLTTESRYIAAQTPSFRKDLPL